MAGRSRIVNIAVLAAAVFAAFAFSLVMVASPQARVDRPDATYWGARILPPGPAADGLPIVPVRVDDAGWLWGMPTHLAWYRYNGREGAPGALPTYDGNNTFNYGVAPERLKVAHLQGLQPWWEAHLGTPVRAGDFPTPWTAAPAIWRTPAGAEGPAALRVWTIRVDAMAYPTEVRDEFAPDGFLAFVAHDTHFGCEVGWELTNSPRARVDDRPVLFDSCHDSRYDPRDIRRYEMPPSGNDD